MCWTTSWVYILATLIVTNATGCRQENIDQAIKHKDVSTEVEAVFIEVAAAAGIDFKHVNGASGRYYYMETYGSGAVFLDYDSDGYQDLYLINSAPLPGYTGDQHPVNALYQNLRDGNFAAVTQQAGVADTSYGMGGCVGDYNNDGHPDLYITNFGPNVLFHNNGNKTFTDMTESSRVGNPGLSTSAAFADIDNDGDLDLYVANNANVSLEDDGGCFQDKVPVYCAPTAYEGASGALYSNNGDGTFSDITRPAGIYTSSGRQLGVVFGDYDDDGDADLYIANDMTANFLYRNDGQAHFSEVGLLSGVALNEAARPEAGMGTDFGDWDNDGDLDLIVCNFQWESCRLYQNEGSSSFADMTAASGLVAPTLATLTFGTVFFDYDNDSDLDLYLANGHVHPEVQKFDPSTTYAQQDQLFRNNGNGSYTDISAPTSTVITPARVGRGAAVADYDNDGDLDLIVTNNNQRPMLLRNDSNQNNHWISIKLIGTLSNRDGIGAKIEVITGTRVLTREVRSASSYLSQDDLRVHFGLGQQPTLNRLTIRWPSNIVQTLNNVAIDQILIVEEALPGNINPANKP